jgi:hypothetical protein
VSASQRRCRDCSACCTTHAVPEIQKPEHTRCSKLRAGWKPCIVYDERPEACRVFECLWLQVGKPEIPRGPLRDEDRPDRLGAVFDYDDHPKYGPTIKVFPLAEGALERPRVRELAAWFAQSALVIGMSQGHRVVLGGPPGVVQRFGQDVQLAMLMPR